MRDARGGRQAPGTIRETLLVTDRTALRVFRVQSRVVVTVDITTVVTARREVNARRKGTVGIELGVLRVGPLDLEVTLNRVVRHASLTRHVITVTDIEVTREMITPYIFRLRADGPRTFGVYIAYNLQIHVIVDREVITAVT